MHACSAITSGMSCAVCALWSSSSATMICLEPPVVANRITVFNELFATGYAFSHDGELMAYSLGRYGLHAPRACMCSTLKPLMNAHASTSTPNVLLRCNPATLSTAVSYSPAVTCPLWHACKGARIELGWTPHAPDIYATTQRRLRLADHPCHAD